MAKLPRELAFPQKDSRQSVRFSALNNRLRRFLITNKSQQSRETSTFLSKFDSKHGKQIANHSPPPESCFEQSDYLLLTEAKDSTNQSDISRELLQTFSEKFETCQLFRTDKSARSKTQQEMGGSEKE
jgi:hypothetical protein